MMSKKFVRMTAIVVVAAMVVTAAISGLAMFLH